MEWSHISLTELPNYVPHMGNSVRQQMNVFCFSGSGGGPHCAGGCRVLVGPVFQKASKLEALQQASDLLVWCSGQWTVLLFTGKCIFPGKTRQSFQFVTDMCFYLWRCASLCGLTF